jgi:hypothetical protein
MTVNKNNTLKTHLLVGNYHGIGTENIFMLIVNVDIIMCESD